MNVKILGKAVHDSGRIDRGRDIAEGTIKEIATMDMWSYKGRQDKEWMIRDRDTESGRNRNGSPR